MIPSKSSPLRDRPEDIPGKAQELANLYASLSGQLRRLADETDGAVALLDHDRKVILLTQGFVDLFGISDNFSHCPLRVLLRACSEQMKEPEDLLNRFEELLTAGPRHAAAVEGTTSSGATLNFVLQPIADPDIGCHQGWVLSASGETNQEPDLAQLLGHELNLPLQGVISSVDILSRGAISPEQRDLIETMKASGQALSDAVLGIRSMSDDQTLVAPEHLRIVDLFVSLQNMFRPLLSSEQIRFWLCPGLGEERVSDPRLIRHVLVNLIENSLRHAGGEVTVKAEASGSDHVIFSVSDQGRGISPDRQQRIFAPCVSFGEKGGSGLGLYIASEMVRRLGGQGISLDSSSFGSTFSFQIPMPKVTTSCSSQILVVDDDEMSRELLGEEIELIGFRSAKADSWQSALEYWREAEPEMALVDVCLPGRGGIELAAKMRLMAPERCLVSISGLPEQEQFFVDRGFDAHIGKPVTFSRLQGLLNRFLGPAPGVSNLVAN
jgi:CheY-like chemotaxis protein